MALLGVALRTFYLDSCTYTKNLGSIQGTCGAFPLPCYGTSHPNQAKWGVELQGCGKWGECPEYSLICGYHFPNLTMILPSACCGYSEAYWLYMFVESWSFLWSSFFTGCYGNHSLDILVRYRGLKLYQYVKHNYFIF